MHRDLPCRYDNFLFATMAFVRGVAEGGLAPSHPKYVLAREEWGTASLFLSQEIVSWLPTSNESSALFEMGEKNHHHQKPWCQGDGVMSSGMHLILLLGTLVFVSDC